MGDDISAFPLIDFSSPLGRARRLKLRRETLGYGSGDHIKHTICPGDWSAYWTTSGSQAIDFANKMKRLNFGLQSTLRTATPFCIVWLSPVC